MENTRGVGVSGRFQFQGSPAGLGAAPCVPAGVGVPPCPQVPPPRGRARRVRAARSAPAPPPAAPPARPGANIPVSCCSRVPVSCCSRVPLSRCPGTEGECGKGAREGSAERGGLGLRVPLCRPRSQPRRERAEGGGTGIMVSSSPWGAR